MRPSARRRVVAAVCLVALLVGCRAAPAVAPAVPGDMVELVDALRGGGHVLFLRHAATDTSIPSGGDDHRGDCGGQRNLTREGREDAAALGAALDALGVPVGEVLASPYCRTLDTARLAFGDFRVDDRLLPLSDAAERLGGLLAPPPAGEPNRVLVGHSSTMATAFEVQLQEGEAAVLGLGSDGAPRPVGRLSAGALGATRDGG